MRTYLHLLPDSNDTFCRVGDLPSAIEELTWMIREGHRLGEKYPSGVTFKMSSEHPGIVVADMIRNTLGYCLVSSRLKALLEREAGVEIEFLRFKLMNHKGRLASDDCYIANIIGSRDWVDMASTEGRQSFSEPGTYMRLKRLVLDNTKVDPDVRIFRIKPMPRVLIIRDDLWKIFEENGITGVNYQQVGEPVHLV